MDALCYALKYKGSKQLILRRTYVELERSLILNSKFLYGSQFGKYLKQSHIWCFNNGSIIEFGCCDNEYDVSKYQSAEYEVLRFDEVTHFTEYQYCYLLSRIRGANNYPKQVKSTGNPGGVGHSFIKKRFIDKGSFNKTFTDKNGRSYFFIQSLVSDNSFLMKSDPSYIKRLEALPEIEKKRLLYGDWDAFDGAFFPEFDRMVHVSPPFEIPKSYRRFASLDYGLDMTACLWWAIDSEGRAIIYRELYEKNLNLTNAAKRILSLCPKDENLEYIVASPDLWNRRQETGISGAAIMFDAGLCGLIKADDRKVIGLRTLREWLSVFTDEFGKKRSRLTIIDGSCKNLIRTLPALQTSKLNPEVISDSPHELTHAPEALRYGIMSRPKPFPKADVAYDFDSFRVNRKDSIKEYLEY
ncbi:MAG: terminase family protein [Clostridia bacterium]